MPQNLLTTYEISLLKSIKSNIILYLNLLIYFIYKSMEHGKLDYYIFVSERLKINTSSEFNFIYDQVFTLIQIYTPSNSPGTDQF